MQENSTQVQLTRDDSIQSLINIVDPEPPKVDSTNNLSVIGTNKLFDEVKHAMAIPSNQRRLIDQQFLESQNPGYTGT